MTEAPVLAIYMITYNHQDYIDQAIASVMSQNTHFSFRLIIGDDGSKDGTFEKCMQWKEKFPDQIDVLTSTKNQGVFNNAGRVFEACIATGAKYIALLEGDDYWCSPDKLERQVTILESDSTIAASYHNTQFLYSDGHFKPIRKALPEVLEMKNVVAKYAPFHTSSFVFRTEHFCRPEWFKNIDSVDLAMYVWHAQFGRFVGINEVMSVYRIHSTSLTASAEHNEKFHQKRVTLYQMLQGKIDPPYLDRFDYVLQVHRQNLESQNQIPTAMFLSNCDETEMWQRWMLMDLNAGIISGSIEDSKLKIRGLSEIRLMKWKWWNGYKLKRALLKKKLRYPALIVFKNRTEQGQFENFFLSIDIPTLSLEDLPEDIKSISDSNQRGNHFASWINAHFLPLKA